MEMGKVWYKENTGFWRSGNIGNTPLATVFILTFSFIYTPIYITLSK